MRILIRLLMCLLFVTSAQSIAEEEELYEEQRQQAPTMPSIARNSLQAYRYDMGMDLTFRNAARSPLFLDEYLSSTSRAPFSFLFPRMVEVRNKSGLPIYDATEGNLLGYTDEGYTLNPKAIVTQTNGRQFLIIENDEITINADETKTRNVTPIAVEITPPPGETQETTIQPIVDWTPGVQSKKYSVAHNRVVSVFNEPGLTYEDCKRERDKGLEQSCIGWPEPDLDSEIEVIDSRATRIIDGDGNLQKQKLYYKVKFSYETDTGVKKSGEGWMSADDIKPGELSRQELEEYYAQKGLPFPEEDYCETHNGSTPKRVSPIMEVVRTAQKASDAEYESFAANNAELFATCSFSSSENAQQRQRKVNAAGNPFRDILRKHWDDNHASGQMPTFRGRPVTEDQMFAMVSMARALYGEMRGPVYHAGPEYAQLAAKTMLNRSEIVKSRAQAYRGSADFAPVSRLVPFVKEKGKDYGSMSDAEVLSYTLQSSKQYSVFNKDDDNLMSMLCPDTSKMNGQDRAAWNAILPIAAEAVLDSENFLPDVPNNFTQYTSRINQPWGDCYKQIASFDMGEGNSFTPKASHMRAWIGEPGTACEVKALRGQESFIAMLLAGIHL